MIGTLEINGKKMVVLEQEEYDRLLRDSGHVIADEADLPSLPKPDRHGRVDAIAYARADIARTIIRDRRAAGLSQQALADLAGMRQATIARLEAGKQTATQQTLKRIETALKSVARKKNAR
jgi:ribosome-binding protein aMBF1 (putative translation factor)